MSVTERLAILVEANAGKAIAEFKTLGNATKGLSGDVGKAGGALSKLGGSVGSLAGSAGPAAVVGVVGLAVAKFAADGVTAFVTLAGEVKEFRRVAGGTAEEASKLVAGFKAVGIDATTAATGVFMLEKHLASGADKLAAFGVTAVKDTHGNTDMTATLLSLGDAYKNISDPVQKAALLTAAFGRSGTALIPLLGKSREEIEHFFDTAGKHHEILSDEDLRKATEYKLAMHDLGEAFKGLQREAGKALVPLLTDIAKAITGTVELIDKIDHALHIKQGSSGGIGAAIDSMIHNTDVTNETTTATANLGSGLADLGIALKGSADAADEDAKSLKDLGSAIQTSVDADRALADAHGHLADAQADLNKLQNESAVDAKKVADAQRSVADALRTVGHAQREQKKAQEEYNDALAAANILGTDTSKDKLADAADNLADANDSVASAQQNATKAAKDLRDAQAGDPEYQDKLAAAKKKVADATDEVSRKALAAVTAQNAEKTAVSENADQVQRLFNLYGDLIKQSPEAAKALAPSLAVLGGAGATGGAFGTPGGPHVLEVPLNPQPLPSGAPVSGGTTTNNVTINATTSTADAHLIAKEVMWNLN